MFGHQTIFGDNLVLSTGLIMWIGHRKEIRKRTFRALALRRSDSLRRANAQSKSTKEGVQTVKCLFTKQFLIVFGRPQTFPVWSGLKRYSVQSRDCQSKGVDPPLSPSCTQFFRGCYLCGAWTTRATFWQLTETNWQEMWWKASYKRFGFHSEDISWQGCFLHCQPCFC